MINRTLTIWECIRELPPFHVLFEANCVSMYLKTEFIVIEYNPLTFLSGPARYFRGRLVMRRPPLVNSDLEER